MISYFIIAAGAIKDFSCSAKQKKCFLLFQRFIDELSFQFRFSREENVEIFLICRRLNSIFVWVENYFCHIFMTCLSSHLEKRARESEIKLNGEKSDTIDWLMDLWWQKIVCRHLSLYLISCSMNKRRGNFYAKNETEMFSRKSEWVSKWDEKVASLVIFLDCIQKGNFRVFFFPPHFLFFFFIFILDKKPKITRVKKFSDILVDFIDAKMLHISWNFSLSAF